MIHVTKSFLPEFEEYLSEIKRIWESNQLTNNGPLVQELEAKLAQFLGVKNLIYVGNGTIALQLALKALKIKGEILTTPFSYCATTHAILWEESIPIFCDIDIESWTPSIKQIKDKFNSQTAGILLTHVFGNTKDLEEIIEFGKEKNIPVIFDGAHAFNVKYKNQSIFNFGDVSTCSFHSTKLFHTIEGGAIITKEDELADTIRKYRSFGHKFDDYFLPGINGKNSEFHAAMGLVNLRHFNEILEHRQLVSNYYSEHLDKEIFKFTFNQDISQNYGYYPILLNSEDILLKIMNELNQLAIYPRRYFYPSLNNLPYLEKQSCPISEDIAKRVLCLPLSHDIDIKVIKRIIEKINEVNKKCL